MENQENTPQNQNQVQLFNGEPVIPVVLERNNIYRWATKAHGRLSSSSKAFVKAYMKRHGYKYYIARTNKIDAES